MGHEQQDLIADLRMTFTARGKESQVRVTLWEWDGNLRMPAFGTDLSAEKRPSREELETVFDALVEGLKRCWDRAWPLEDLS